MPVKLTSIQNKAFHIFSYLSWHATRIKEKKPKFLSLTSGRTKQEQLSCWTAWSQPSEQEVQNEFHLFPFPNLTARELSYCSNQCHRTVISLLNCCPLQVNWNYDIKHLGVLSAEYACGKFRCSVGPLSLYYSEPLRNHETNVRSPWISWAYMFLGTRRDGETWRTVFWNTQTSRQAPVTIFWSVLI